MLVSPPHCHLDPVHAQPRVSAQSKNTVLTENMVGPTPISGNSFHLGEKPDQVCLALTWPKTPVLVRKPSSVSQQASDQSGLDCVCGPWKWDGEAHLVHSCWLARTLLTFDVISQLGRCALPTARRKMRRGPGLACWALGSPGRSQRGGISTLLLPREEGVALDWGPKAGPDAKEGVFPPKCWATAFCRDAEAKPPSLTVAPGPPAGKRRPCTPRNTWWHWGGRLGRGSAAAGLRVSRKWSVWKEKC